MPHVTVGYGVQRDGDERRAFVLVERTPWWAFCVSEAADRLCRLTRNYACPVVCGRAESLTERHRARFETPCTPEHAAALSEWMGWGRPFFMNEDGEQRQYPDRYERMP